MPSLQLRVLESLTEARNYNRWLCDLALPHLGDHPLEIGSGLGHFAQRWLDSGIPRLTASEMDAPGVERLRMTFADEPRADVCEVDISNPPSDLPRFSAVVALNVIEHIEDDRAALAAARKLVRPGGAVVVFVPAHSWAMSSFDRAIGHWRRYSASSLRDTFEDAGLPVETIRYVNAPGLLAWLVGMKLLGRTPTDGHVLRAYDRFVVPLARRFDERVSLPFGQSLFAVGRAAE
jgi:SAM-dependent methyltransferase